MSVKTPSDAVRAGGRGAEYINRATLEPVTFQTRCPYLEYNSRAALAEKPFRKQNEPRFDRSSRDTVSCSRGAACISLSAPVRQIWMKWLEGQGQKDSDCAQAPDRRHQTINPWFKRYFHLFLRQSALGERTYVFPRHDLTRLIAYCSAKRKLDYCNRMFSSFVFWFFGFFCASRFKEKGNSLNYFNWLPKRHVF